MKTQPRSLSASLLLVAVAVGALTWGARPARAELLPIPRLKAGIFVPGSSELSDVVGDTWLKVGADVDVPLGISVLGLSTRLGAEYAVRSGDHILPITMCLVWQPQLVLTSPVYVGAGIGLWFMNVDDESANRFGVRLLGGVNLGRHMFLELQYDRVASWGDLRADGYSAMLGFRF